MKMCMNFKPVMLLVLMLFAGISVYGQDNIIDEVVWVVGNEAILKSEVEEARMSALYEGRKFDGDPYCVIPEEIAVQKLFLHVPLAHLSRQLHDAVGDGALAVVDVRDDTKIP